MPRKSGHWSKYIQSNKRIKKRPKENLQQKVLLTRRRSLCICANLKKICFRSIWIQLKLCNVGKRLKTFIPYCLLKHNRSKIHWFLFGMFLLLVLFFCSAKHFGLWLFLTFPTYNFVGFQSNPMLNSHFIPIARFFEFYALVCLHPSWCSNSY